MTAKTFFERLYLVPGLMPIHALCQHALGAHTPTAHSTTISEFKIFSEWPPNFFVSTIHQAI